jgi:hypothetical protein
MDGCPWAASAEQRPARAPAAIPGPPTRSPAAAVAAPPTRSPAAAIPQQQPARKPAAIPTTPAREASAIPTPSPRKPAVVPLSRFALTLPIVAALTLVPYAAQAQSVPRVIAGWGVDTTATAWSEAAWHEDAVAIYRLWAEYLRSDPRLQQPTAHWSAAEQRQWPAYDLTAGIAYKGFPATVLDIRPATPAADEFVIRTLFASATGDAREVRPIALTRVYAVREDGRWVLSNALPRHTRGWSTATIGGITFVVEGRAVDTARAARTAAFADSIADAFAVPRIDSLTYYVAASPESLHRALGVDWTFGAQGHGYALAANRLVLSGDAVFGEENRHELVHIVLSPVLEERRTHGLVAEGVATFFGGTIGRSYRELVTEYATYLAAHPEVGLDAILEAEGPDRGWYPAGAVLVGLVHERGGVAALQELLRSGRSDDELRATVARLLELSWEEVGAEWRRRIGAPAGHTATALPHAALLARSLPLVRAIRNPD